MSWTDFFQGAVMVFALVLMPILALGAGFFAFLPLASLTFALSVQILAVSQHPLPAL